MKFRNPKTGEVFYTVLRAWKAYCRGRNCDMCDLKKSVMKDGFQDCDFWVDEHPAEAARLMGLEEAETVPC